MSILHIPENILERAGISEKEALVELACRLFDTGRLTLPMAGRLAGISRSEIESALLERKIPIYRPTVEDLRQDLETLDRMGI